jgi:glutamate synthase domain-containing protein 3
MLQKHYEYTGSTIAKFILEDLNNQLQYFVKVFPKDFKKVLQTRATHPYPSGEGMPGTAPAFRKS